MAAVPSIGRADRAAPEADLTRALYERYAAQIFRYCLHQLGSREEAEDAVQSTFLNAFRGIKRGIVPELESAWLFKIAENVCLTRRRSTWRRNRIESTADFDVVEELTPAPSRLADELLGLQDVLEQMPESQRRAILLREWQGLSYREIAAELELSQTAVETLIFRARRSLAKGLAEPPAPAEKRRMVRGADLGNVLTGLKSILFGGAAAAAKTAAVVAALGAGTVAVAEPASHHPRSRPPALAPASTPPAPALRSTRSAPVLPSHRPPVARKDAPAHADRAIVTPEAAPPSPAGRDATPQPAAPAAQVPAPAVQAPVAPAPAPPASQGGSGGQGHDDSGHGRGKGQGQSEGSSGQGSPGEGQVAQGQGSPGDEGQGQANSDPGNSGQGQAQGDSGNHGQDASDSAPPPAGDSGGNGGNGQGNGHGDGGGHSGGAGHGH